VPAKRHSRDEVGVKTRIIGGAFDRVFPEAPRLSGKSSGEIFTISNHPLIPRSGDGRSSHGKRLDMKGA